MHASQIIQIYRTNGVITSTRMAISHIIDTILDCYYRSFPLSPNLILFSSIPDYDDNARVLYDYMMKIGLGKKYDIRWVVNSSKTYNDLTKKGLKCIRRFSIFPSPKQHRFYYYGRTAQWYFHTHGHPFEDGGKRKQHFINLTHGGIGFKINKSVTRGNENEYILASGDGSPCLEYIQKFWNCVPEQALPMGMARYDLFFRKKTILEFDSLIGKKILWMPTFRESYMVNLSDNSLSSETGLPIIYTCSDLNKLNDTLVKLNTHLFITTHPLQKKEKRMIINTSNIHSIDSIALKKQNIQLYEIFTHFDAMISDYSSVSFDYLNLNKPIAYTLDDYEEYKSTRGFAMKNPLEYMPGPHIYSYNDFIKFIRDIVNDNDGYAKERENLLTKLGIHADGNCCKRIVEFFKL